MHKTGTKALQVFLAVNRVRLAETGVHYPLAGRHQLSDGLFTPGHHQIAMDFASSDQSQSFSEVVNEIRLVQASTVILSSEEFLPLAHKPGVLETIVATGRDLGYAPVAVVVLRAQPDYLESIYSEIAKTSSSSSLSDLIEQSARDGRFRPLNYENSFDLTYSDVIGRLEVIFGAGNVIARAYRRDRGLEFGSADFLSVVGYLRGGLQLKDARNPLPSANERVTLLALLTNVAAFRSATFDTETFFRQHFPHFDYGDFARPFSLITRDDRVRLLSRFAADNAAINTRFDIDIPFTSEADSEMCDIDDTRARAHRTLLAAMLDATDKVSPAA